MNDTNNRKSLRMHLEDTDTSEAFLSQYYVALTDLALSQPAGLLSMHYGLWGPETTSDKDALLRANRTLVQDLDLGAGMHVLDAGCGVGGTAIWLAQEYGVQVTGLTNCEPHVALASEEARKRGVGDRVEFHYGDFMKMPFEAACFDAVLNHETFCYASDKSAYFDGVHRVLKPGGRWQALDGFLNDRKMTGDDQSVHEDVQKGWHTEPLACWRDVLNMCEAAGFESVGSKDLDLEVIPAGERLVAIWQLFGHMFIPLTSDKRWAYMDNRQAVYGYIEGIKRGVFTYRLVYAGKPA